MCGEHPVAQASAIARRGSSPRVRGTQIGPGQIGPDQRFIPACAGNTPEQLKIRAVKTVHPRVCGEHGILAQLSKYRCGSSPRVRGTRVHVHGLADCGRFIPACAGNTCWRPSPSRFRAVHPRVCGEHKAAGVPDPLRIGSSPRVRGTLFPEGFEVADFFRLGKSHRCSFFVQTHQNRASEPFRAPPHAFRKPPPMRVKVTQDSVLAIDQTRL